MVFIAQIDRAPRGRYGIRQRWPDTRFYYTLLCSPLARPELWWLSLSASRSVCVWPQQHARSLPSVRPSVPLCYLLCLLTSPALSSFALTAAAAAPLDVVSRLVRSSTTASTSFPPPPPPCPHSRRLHPTPLPSPPPVVRPSSFPSPPQCVPRSLAFEKGAENEELTTAKRLGIDCVLLRVLSVYVCM